ncbi:MAG: site-specific DNA-methyltransferase [Candidatus Methanomethylicaceae archaeon]
MDDKQSLETSLLPLDPPDKRNEARAAKLKTSQADLRANDLDGATWTRYSISVWSDIRKTSEEISLKHPAMFPQALAGRLIECFSRRGMTVLDPFLGVGSTLVAAKRLGRHGIGIELNPEYAEIAQRRLNTVSLDQLWSPEELGSYKVIVDDAHHLDRHVAPQQVDLVVTSPPYWDILLEKRTADYRPIRHYGGEERDLGKIRDYHRFLEALRRIFSKVLVALRPKGYCCVVVMDIRKQDRFYPYHSDFAEVMQDIGFKYDDLIIWDRRHEYNNLRPLGYPSVFRINKVHEYILIFKKPEET